MGRASGETYALSLFILIGIMTYNYLWLVNRLCHKFNEVELNSTTFAGVTGVYADFQDSVNAAIYDIFQDEDQAWPFAWIETSFQTTIGQNKYNKAALALTVDWNSFAIERQPVSLDSIIVSGITGTITVSAGHPFKTGDNVLIQGSDQSALNNSYTVTVTSSTQFTITVPSGTSSSGGTPVGYPDITPCPLTNTDIYAYREEGYKREDDEAIQVGDYGKPSIIVRKPDNNFIITSKPDRIYTVSYDYYTAPVPLVSYSDVPVIPETFKEVIVSGAVYYAYMFRDNTDEASSAKTEFTNAVNRMRRILIPQPQFMRYVP